MTYRELLCDKVLTVRRREKPDVEGFHPPYRRISSKDRNVRSKTGSLESTTGRALRVYNCKQRTGVWPVVSRGSFTNAAPVGQFRPGGRQSMRRSIIVEYYRTEFCIKERCSERQLVNDVQSEQLQRCTPLTPSSFDRVRSDAAATGDGRRAGGGKESREDWMPSNTLRQSGETGRNDDRSPLDGSRLLWSHRSRVTTSSRSADSWIASMIRISPSP